MTTTGEAQVASGEIVVGIDGSASSRDALRWAAAQARLSGKTLHAVMAWEEPTIFVSAETELDRVIQEELGDDRPALRTSLHNGAAGYHLVHLSQSADLLVVGGRGHGALASTLLGSVSEECVHHAACPVVVVRHPTS